MLLALTWRAITAARFGDERFRTAGFAARVPEVAARSQVADMTKLGNGDTAGIESLLNRAIFRASGDQQVPLTEHRTELLGLII